MTAVAQNRYGGAPPAAPGPGAGDERTEGARKGGWQIIPEVDLEFDLTDNVDLAPSDRKRGDLVTQIVPRLTFLEKGAHTSFSGSVAALAFLYARTGGENNTVHADVNLRGTAELAPRLFFVDAAVNVSQQYFSPFGAQSQSLANANKNQYTSQLYRVSPYLKGESRGDFKYELRDNNIWSNATSAPVATNASYTNELIGNVTREARPLGWAVDYKRDETTFTGQPAFRDQLARARGLWLPEPEIEVSASAGYEDADYPTLSTSDFIYGAGFRWHPNERTRFDATWEHRFFGSSYHVEFANRTRLTTWSLTASRDITTYPQQLAALGAGTEVAPLLDQIFAPRITDPFERQTFVDQFIRERGLPSVLGSPLTLYTEQVTLRQAERATVGLLGARNTLFLSAEYVRNEPVTGQDSTVPIDVLLQNNTTQYGTNVVWTHKITSLYVLTASGDWYRTLSNLENGPTARHRAVRLVLSARLSPLTDVYAGARHQALDSDAATSYRETAVFVGLRHVFR